MKYKNKKIISGKMLECELYPVYDSNMPLPKRAPKLKETNEYQKKLNKKNAIKRIVRLVNTNFSSEDLFIHPTYRDDQMPSTYEEVLKDFNNYVRRLNRYQKKMGKEKIKYIAVIECKVSKRTGLIRYHIHMILSKMDWQVAISKWKFGDFCNCDVLKENEFGLEGAAKYLVKEPLSKKRWLQSQGLKEPKEKKVDARLSKRKIEKICLYKEDAKEIFEKQNPGYRVVRVTPEFNEYNLHWYLSVIMRKIT